MPDLPYMTGPCLEKHLGTPGMLQNTVDAEIVFHFCIPVLMPARVLRTGCRVLRNDKETKVLLL